ALRIAIVFDEGADVVPLAVDVRDALHAFAARLERNGVKVEAVDLPVPLADGLRSWQELAIPIIGADLPDDAYESFRSLEETAGDDPVLTSARALVSRYRTWARANERRQHQRTAWASFFERYDAVLTPVVPTVAFPHDTDRPIHELTIEIDGRSVPQVVA